MDRKKNYLVGCQVLSKRGLTSHYHESFIIAREKYLVKRRKIRKGMEGMNDSQCLFFLLLVFVFYKELYFLIITMCLFLFLHFLN